MLFSNFWALNPHLGTVQIVRSTIVPVSCGHRSRCSVLAAAKLPLFLAVCMTTDGVTWFELHWPRGSSFVSELSPSSISMAPVEGPGSGTTYTTEFASLSYFEGIGSIAPSITEAIFDNSRQSGFSLRSPPPVRNISFFLNSLTFSAIPPLSCRLRRSSLG